MGVELPLRVVVTILECCVTFSGVKLSIRSFVLFICTLNGISDKLKTLSVDEDTRLIWGGDWNCILDMSLDAMGDHPL